MEPLDRQTRIFRLLRSRSATVFFIAVTLVAGIYFARLSGDDPRLYRNDFNVFFFASQEVTAGRDPYQNSLGQWTPYLYPPLLAEAMIPLTLLPLPAAAYLWFLMSVGATAASFRMLQGATQGQGSEKDFIPLAGALIVFARFTLDNLSLGQVNIMVAALAIAHVYLFDRGRKFSSMLMLSVAVSIKLTPAVLLGWHIARGRFKYALQNAAGIIILLALSFVPFGSDPRAAIDSFMNRTVRNEQGFDLAYHGNQSLRGALARLIGNAVTSERQPLSAAWLLASLLMIGSSLLASSRASDTLAQAAPFFCCMALLSPLGWKAHFVALLLPAFFLLREASETESRRKRIALISSVIIAAICFNLTSPRLIGLGAAEWADSHSLVFAGAMSIFIAVVAISVNRRRRGPTSASLASSPTFC
jgi:alpha-1,2-mannosyltransferase